MQSGLFDTPERNPAGLRLEQRRRPRSAEPLPGRATISDENTRILGQISLFEGEGATFLQAAKSEAEVEGNFRRAANLAIFHPLLSLGFNASRAPFHLLDFFSLGVEAIDFCLRSVGLGSISTGGVQRDTLTAHLSQRIEEQLEAMDDPFTFPEDAEIRRAAADLVIQLVEGEGGRPFSRRVYNTRTKTFRNIQFRLLEEIDDADNRFYLRPSIAATNLYCNHLDLSLEDMQVALQSLLEHQIRTGQVHKAHLSARDHLLTTLRHKEAIYDFKRRISTNVRNMSWREEIEPRLAEINRCVPEFLAKDKKLLDSVARNVEMREGEHKSLANALIKIFRHCIHVNQELASTAISLDQQYRKELERQGFHPALSAPRPDLLREVLEPMMELSVSTLDVAAGDFLAVLTGPSAMPLFDLRTMLCVGLRDRRVPTVESVENDDLSLIPFEVRFDSTIDKEEIDLAYAFLQQALTPGERLLSAVIDQAVDADLSLGTQRAIVLLAQAIWGDGEKSEEWRAEKCGGRFERAMCVGDEMRITYQPGGPPR